MRKFGISEFTGSQPTLVEAKVAKNYLNEKELREMGQSTKLALSARYSKIIFSS